jgi:hypothetical protein
MEKLSTSYIITWIDQIFTITWTNIYSTISFSNYNYIVTLHSAPHINLFDFGGTTLN